MSLKNGILHGRISKHFDMFISSVLPYCHKCEVFTLTKVVNTRVLHYEGRKAEKLLIHHTIPHRETSSYTSKTEICKQVN